MKDILCFDVGGTNISYGILVGDDLGFLGSKKTPEENCRVEIPNLISGITNDLKTTYNIGGIGISTAGNLDREKGVVLLATSFNDYSGAKLVEDIEAATGIKTFIENDVNAAALGERYRGAGEKEDNFVCLTIGTSIGGAVFIDGELYRGENDLAGEIGHMIININGEICPCGSRGCYEVYASTKALVKMYEEASGISDIDGKEIVRRLEVGEELAVEIFDIFVNNVALGLVNVGHIFDPKKIIIGGGISEAGEIFFKPLVKAYNANCMESYRDKLEIVPAELGNQAGLYGMGYLGRKMNL